MSSSQVRRSPIEASRSGTVLVIDSDSELSQSLRRVIQEFRLSLLVCERSTHDLKLFGAVAPPDVVLVNLSASELGLELLPEMRQLWPSARVIFLADSSNMHLYVDAIKLGAYDFLPKTLGTHDFGTVIWDVFSTLPLNCNGLPGRA